MTSAADENPGDWMTGRLLATAARVVEHRWNERLRDCGVSHAGLVLLHSLSHGPAGQRELASRLRVTEQTLARTVATLESSGHVRRHQGQSDRRRRTVEITPTGTALLARMSAAGSDLTDDIVRSRGGDLEAFRAGLLALVDHLGPPDRLPPGRPDQERSDASGGASRSESTAPTDGGPTGVDRS